MTIKRIEIDNIKGISSRNFELNILANRPSLLVAPNGFGKSSIASAFLSLKTNKLSVKEEHFHKSDSALNPKLLIEYEDKDGTSHTLIANETSNTIAEHFSCFVINNQIKAKGVGRNFGGRTIVSASITVESVTLIETIPAKKTFIYSFRNQKELFGSNGKVLPNISSIFRNLQFIKELGLNFSNLDKISQAGKQKNINRLITSVNSQTGNVKQLRAWIANNKIADLESIEPLNELSELILNSSLNISSQELSFLAAIQLHRVYSHDKAQFKKALKYSNYTLEKAEYTEMINAFNTSWCSVSPKEKKES